MMKIQTKMAITIAVVAISILLTTGIFSYFSGMNSVKEMSSDRLTGIATAQAKRFDSMVDHYLDHLRMISEQTLLLQKLKTFNSNENPEALAQISSILNDFQTAAAPIRNVSIFNKEKKLVIPNNSGKFDHYPINIFSTPLNQPTDIGMLILKDEAIGLRIFFLKKLWVDKIELGLLILEIKNDEFFRFFSSNDLVGDTGESYILRVSPNGNEQFLPPFRIIIPESTIFSSTSDFPKDTKKEILEFTDYHGAKVYAVSYPVLNNELQYIVKIDQNEVYVSINNWITRALALFTLVSIISIFISILLSNRISQSLRLLTHKVNDFREGAFTPFEDSNKTDWEVRQLENAFINMAETRNSIEQLVKKNEQYLSLMLNSIGEGVIATDVNGLITKINPVAAQLTGWLVDSAIGKPLIDVFNVVDSETRIKIESPVDLVITRNESVLSGNNSLLISKNGHEFQIAESASPIKEEDNVHGVIIVFQDITEEHKLRTEQEEHQLFFKNVLDDMQTFAGVLETDGTLIFANNTAIKTAGVSESEVMGKKLWDTIWFSHDNNVREQLKLDIQDAARGNTVLHDMQVNMNGSILWVQFNIHPIFDNNGNVKYLVPEGQNIESRVQTEQALRESKERLRLHQELTVVGFIEWDQDFNVTDWNPAAEKIFGYSHNEAIGKHVIDLIIPTSERGKAQDVIEHLKVESAGTHTIFENITKQGNIIFCEWYNTPLTNSAGEIIGLASIVSDITLQRQKEEQLRRSQKLDALGQLSGGIAHDFNNMLNIMLGYTELIKEKDYDSSTLDKYIEQIEQAGARCTNLTRKLLGFSKSLPDTPSHCDINQELLQSQHILEKSLTARINIKFDLQNNIWPVLINTGEFQDSLINLGINSMHAMPEGGTLTLMTTNTTLENKDATQLGLLNGEYVKFSIIDTGFGMDEETQSHIFDPFFTTKGEKGSGLGLSQVYGFVKRAGGIIKVDSGIKLGSRFDLYFPRLMNNVKSTTSNVNIRTDQVLNGHETILVVDDELALRELSADILGRHGYNVVCASNGEDALNILKSKNIDLVLSDIIMPGISGYELQDAITEKYPDIKIQLISGYNKNESTNGSNMDFLLKPFVAKDLLLRIRTLLDEPGLSIN